MLSCCVLDMGFLQEAADLRRSSLQGTEMFQADLLEVARACETTAADSMVLEVVPNEFIRGALQFRQDDLGVDSTPLGETHSQSARGNGGEPPMAGACRACGFSTIRI